jgi:hypothetical protein
VYRTTDIAVNEPLATSVVSEAGHWLVPTTDAANLSVHVHLGTGRERPAWDDSARRPDPDITYVSFTISDGDAMGYVQTMLRWLHLDRIGPDTVPIGVSTGATVRLDRAEHLADRAG